MFASKAWNRALILELVIKVRCFLNDPWPEMVRRQETGVVGSCTPGFGVFLFRVEYLEGKVVAAHTHTYTHMHAHTIVFLPKRMTHLFKS